MGTQASWQLNACRSCAVPLLNALASATKRAVRFISEGMPVAPSTSEEIQDSVAAIYGLMQLCTLRPGSQTELKLAFCNVSEAMLHLIQVLILKVLRHGR